MLFTLDDKEEEKKKGLRFDIISNILFLGGSKAMGKIKKRPINIRTVGDEAEGKYSVSDEWPSRSFSGKYFLPSRTLTRVATGEVYMNEYILGKAPTTTIHRAGNMFAQDPDTVYAVGSVYGAHTVSFSEAPIDPIFIPEERDDED